MSKHTPGPWVVDESRHDGAINRLEPFRHIGMVSAYREKPGDREENEANARLIAASPQLLMALEDALEVLQPLAEQLPSVKSRCEGYARIIRLAREGA